MYKNIWTREKNDKDKGGDAEVRCSIFKTLGIFGASLESLKIERDNCIGEAREAKDRGDDFAYQSAKKKLRLYLLNIRIVSEMLVELEISLELDNMHKIVESYSSCIDSMKKHRSINFNLHNDGKKLKENRKDLSDMINQHEGLYKDFSSGAWEGEGAAAISDDELESIINQGDDVSDSITEEINARIKLIKSKIGEG